MNHVTISGKVYRVQTRKAGDHRVTSFAVGVSNGKDKGLSFVEVDLWNADKNMLNTLVDDSWVVVNGRLRMDEWETEEGEKRNKVKVVANQVSFMPERSSDTGGGKSNVRTKRPRRNQEVNENVPF